MGIAAKGLSNVGKLKVDSEALKQIELKVITEVLIAKTLIANASMVISSSLEIGMKMGKENFGKVILPSEGKKYYPVELQVVKNYVNTNAVFVDNAFK